MNSGFYNDNFSQGFRNFNQSESDVFSNEYCDNYDYGFDFTDQKLNDNQEELQNLKKNLNILKDLNKQEIIDSEKHLKEESSSINQDRDRDCNSLLNHYKVNDLKAETKNLNIPFNLMEKLINALIESCTKENICNAKNWIIEQSNKGSLVVNIILEYMMFRVAISNEFNEKLHIIYLTNDLLHYCKRKNSDVILHSIERFVLQIYLMCSKNITEDQKIKLNKVLSLWESNNYLNIQIINSLKKLQDDPVDYLNNLHSEELRKYKEKEDFGMIKVDNNSNSLSHIRSDAHMKIQNLESNHNQLRHDLKLKEESLEVEIYNLERQIESILENQKQSNFQSSFQMPDITQPPPGFIPSVPPSLNSSRYDDFDDHVESRTFSTNQFSQENIDIAEEKLDSLPYWRLPSAVMLVQIRLGDFDYEPIDADSIKLPHLQKPSKKLLDSVHHFYSPTTEICRDSDGWEIGKLEEFFKLKDKVRKNELPNDIIRDIHSKMNEQDNDIEDNEIMMHSLRAHQGPEIKSNPRSLLGNPWESQPPPVFDHYEVPNFPVNRPPPTNISNRNVPPRVTPLMSLDLGTDGLPIHHHHHMPLHHQQPHLPRNRQSFNYQRRPRSQSFDRASSKSYSRSRSRSRSSTYSRSPSRSKSPPRSASRRRSTSKSSKSSSPIRERYSRSYSRSPSDSPVRSNESSNKQSGV